jgi:hypothetical protein
MNRRSFLSFSLLVPVAGVMAARDAMAAPAMSPYISGTVGEMFIGDGLTPGEFAESYVARVRKMLGPEMFGVDNIAPAIPTRSAEDESVSAQFETDLAFLRDEPGVAI